MKSLKYSLLTLVLALPQLAQGLTLTIPNYKGSDCSETAKGSPNDPKNGSILAKGNPVLRGVCLYQNRPTGSGEVESKRQYLDSLTQEMASAQQFGLGSESQNLAALIEGLAHCEQAKLFWANKKEIPVPGGSGTIADTMSANGFCSERTKAAGSLSDVKWGFLDVKQEANADFLEQMLNAVTSCQSDVIGQYTRCEQIEPQRAEDLEAQVLFQVDKAMIKYFGCDAQEATMCDSGRSCSDAQKERYNLCKQYGASAPASAMFSRKRDRVVAVGTASDEKLSGLESRATFINNRFAVYQDQFQVALAIASETVNTYKAAALLTKEITDELTRWENGLLAADVKDGLDKTRGDLTVLSQPLDKVVADVSVIADRVESLMVPEAEKKASLLQACQIYYCGLQNAQVLSRYQLLCGGDGAPPQDSFANNSVCLGKVTLPAVGGTAPSTTLANLCKDLSANYRRPGLAMNEASLCLKDLVLANKDKLKDSNVIDRLSR